jgi:hypothetical protein
MIDEGGRIWRTPRFFLTSGTSMTTRASSIPCVRGVPLAKEGWRIQRDTPGYGPRRTAEELRRDLAAAKRYADQ